MGKVILKNDDLTDRQLEILICDAIHDFVTVRGGYRGIQGCEEYVKKRYAVEYQKSNPKKAQQVHSRCMIAINLLGAMETEQ